MFEKFHCSNILFVDGAVQFVVKHCTVGKQALNITARLTTSQAWQGKSKLASRLPTLSILLLWQYQYLCQLCIAAILGEKYFQTIILQTSGELRRALKWLALRICSQSQKKCPLNSVAATKQRWAWIRQSWDASQWLEDQWNLSDSGIGRVYFKNSFYVHERFPMQADKIYKGSKAFCIGLFWFDVPTVASAGPADGFHTIVYHWYLHVALRPELYRSPD